MELFEERVAMELKAATSHEAAKEVVQKVLERYEHVASFFISGLLEICVFSDWLEENLPRPLGMHQLDQVLYIRAYSSMARFLIVSELNLQKREFEELKRKQKLLSDRLVNWKVLVDSVTEELKYSCYRCPHCGTGDAIPDSGLCGFCGIFQMCRSCFKEMDTEQGQKYCNSCVGVCVDCKVYLTENEHRWCTSCLLDNDARDYYRDN